MKFRGTKAIACAAVGMALLGSDVMAEKRQGGTLSLVVRQTDAHVRNFNPHNLAVGFYAARDFVYEPLWIYNIKNPGEDFPWLATSYEVAEDLKSVTYTLREGVKWSDGETFDADDIVFTGEYLKEHLELPANLQMYSEKNPEGMVESIEKLGQYKVKFHLKEKSALAHYSLGRIYPLPEHIWKSIDNPKTFTNDNPVATGPFTNVKSFKTTEYTVCRNDNYWQKGKPYVDCLRFPQFSGNDQVMAVAAKGQIDWMGMGLTSPEKTYANKHPNNHYWLPAASGVNLQLNTKKAPFNSVDFRRAMSIAINRTDLLEIATFGLTTETKYPIGTGEEYKGWYDTEKLAKYKHLMEYSPEKAKSILDKAGFVDKDGDGWRDNLDGSPIEFNLSVPNGWTDWVNSQLTISENLQDIGLNAHLHTPDEGAWFDAIANADFDVYIMWTNAYAIPWKTYSDLFNPKAMKPGQIQAQTLHQMEIPEINALLKKFAKTTDLNEQKELIGDVHALVAENLPVISLFANPSWYEYNDSRFEGWVTEENPYVRPAVHGGTPERLVHVLNLSLKAGVSAK